MTIDGSQIETKWMKKELIESISIVWSDRCSSHAFMLEQILNSLEKAGYAPREEIIDGWGAILKGLTKE